MSEVIAPVVMKEMFINCVSPSVAPYSALVIIPEKANFLELAELSGNNSNNASPVSPVVNISSTKDSNQSYQHYHI